jgi:hypothetical protein
MLVGDDDLLAGDLLVDRRQHALFLFVLVFARVVAVGRGLLDQLQRELQFGLLDVDLFDVQVAHRAHLVGVQQLLQDQPVFAGAHLHHVLFALPDPARQCAAAAFLHRRDQQPVRLAAALVGHQVVGLVVVDRVDRAHRDERDNVDGVPRRFFQRLQFRRREGDIAVLVELVALDHVGAFDRHAFLQAHVLLLQPRAAVVQQVEADRTRGLGGRIQLDRYRHQPEAERQRGD